MGLDWGPQWRDPKFLTHRIQHHQWWIEFGGSDDATPEDHARVIRWLERKLADAWAKLV